MLKVGSILDYRNDPNPSSGDHLDIKILRKYGKGGHVDPSTKQGLLSRFKFGNADTGFKTLADYTMTSGYGPRDTGIPGASKFHKGLDYGIGAGTQIHYDGEGKYWSENGIGIISVTDDAGNPYEIELTHTAVGDPSEGLNPGNTPTDGDASNDNPTHVKAKEKATAWATRAKSAEEVVAGFGNDFGSMKSKGLGSKLQSVQEGIVQKRMDANPTANFGTVREKVEKKPDPG